MGHVNSNRGTHTMPPRKRPRDQESSSSTEDEEKEEEEETAYDMEEEDTEGIIHGTLKDLHHYWDQGLLQENQCCSLEKSIMGRTNGALCCTLHHRDGKLVFTPCENRLQGQQLVGAGLTRIYNDRFHDTHLYHQTPSNKRGLFRMSHHFYHNIRFHFALRAHPSIVIAVPVTDLSFLQTTQEEWMPIVLHLNSNPISSPPPTINNHQPKPSHEIDTLPKLYGLRLALYNKANGAIQLHESQDSVTLSDETEYGIELENATLKHAAADVYIDGRFQGEFLLEPKQRIVLERPINEPRRFIFAMRGAQTATSTIHVRFIPQIVLPHSNRLIRLQRESTVIRDTVAPPVAKESHTLLSSPSNQHISTLQQLFTFNELASITLQLKLVGTASSSSRMLPISDCRTL